MGKYLKSVGKNSLDFLKYVGPGLLVTVGFIDPGNWASNIAAGSGYGYSLLWMVTLSTLDCGCSSGCNCHGRNSGRCHGS